VASLDARKSRESRFHDELYRRHSPGVEAAVYREDFVEYLRERAFAHLGDLRQRRLLFYGCGVQFGLAMRFCELGAQVVMIDISSEAIKRLNERVRQTGHADRLVSIVMDCENLGLCSESFDAVFGNAIIHHLDTRRAVTELHRVLKLGGRAAFIEPLAANPVVNVYRRLTPGLRTADEHPLTAEDWTIFQDRFPSFRQRGYTFFALVPVIVNAVAARVGLPIAMKSGLFRRIDEFVLRAVPGLRDYCWNTVIELEK
jgi:ubiquinone/menaquinone biosynthesis C-methylase UbiE